MPRTLDIVEICDAREKGRKKVLSLVSEWPDALPARDRQIKLKELYGHIASPLHMILENFTPENYRERNCDSEELKLILLGGFQAVESANSICDLMATYAVDASSRADYDTIRVFTQEYKRQLCAAFYNFVTGARPGSEDRIIRYEAALARRGNFPEDLLSSLLAPRLQQV